MRSGTERRRDVAEPSFLDGMRAIRDLQRVLRAPGPPDRRHDAMVEARREGWTYDEIAHALGMTREHVYQVLKRRGIPPPAPTSLDAEAVAAARALTAAFAASVKARSKKSKPGV
jgi:hypothetical protein